MVSDAITRSFGLLDLRDSDPYQLENVPAPDP
jgi:hypothetical protein